MGSYFDKYKKRLEKRGTNDGEVYLTDSANFYNSIFHKSPSFRVMDVISSEFPNINKIDARVNDIERMGSLREILFRPHETLNLGTLVKFDDDTWLIFDIFGSKQALNSRALVQRCNDYIIWKGSDGEVYRFNCIASAMGLGSKANIGRNEIEYNKQDVRLPVGYLLVSCELNDATNTIALNQRFIFSDKVYEVVGIDKSTLVDKNYHGVLQLNIKITTNHPNDDFENKIAYNRFNNNDDLDNDEIIMKDGETEDDGLLW